MVGRAAARGTRTWVAGQGALNPARRSEDFELLATCFVRGAGDAGGGTGVSDAGLCILRKFQISLSCKFSRRGSPLYPQHPRQHHPPGSLFSVHRITSRGCARRKARFQVD